MEASVDHADIDPKGRVASALKHAERRAVAPVCLLFGDRVDATAASALLARVQAKALRGTASAADLCARTGLRNDSKLGLYWLPSGAETIGSGTHVYFVGSRELIGVGMIRGAMARNVSSLRLPLGSHWIALPISVFSRVDRVLRRLRRPAQGPAGSASEDASSSAPAQIADQAALQRVFERWVRAGAVGRDGIAGRIVHVCGNLQPGGAERQVVYVLHGLSRANYESVQLLCHYLFPGKDRYDFYAPALAAAGIPAREIRRATASQGLAGMPSALREARGILPADLLADIADRYREFIELRPEVVHAWLDWDNVRAGLAAVLAGVPKVILSGRNVNPSHFELYQACMDPAYRALAQAPNVHMINNSRAGADDYADWIGIPRTRIGVVHNAVEFAGRRRSSAAEARAGRQALGIPADAFVVGGAFRLESEKRPLLWVATAALVAEVLPDAWFVIYGQGRMYERVIAAASDAGLEQRLILPGLTGDIVSAMSMMDVLLLTSSGEGLPNVLLEAQWSGTPVVTADVGGAKEAIDVGATGWPIASDDAHDFAEKILWLHRNPQVRSAAIDRGPLFVQERFSVERLISETRRLYEIE